jgi:hypothetical protein
VAREKTVVGGGLDEVQEEEQRCRDGRLEEPPTMREQARYASVHTARPFRARLIWGNAIL